MSRKAGAGKWQMMEMPDGITTSNGSWYHITSKQIEQYVPGLQKKVILERLIQQADAWVLSADALSLLLFLVLMVFVKNQILYFQYFFLQKFYGI